MYHTVIAPIDVKTIGYVIPIGVLTPMAALVCMDRQSAAVRLTTCKWSAGQGCVNQFTTPPPKG